MKVNSGKEHSSSESSESLNSQVEDLTGRELDAAIAERVMGWKRVRSDRDEGDDRKDVAWMLHATSGLLKGEPYTHPSMCGLHDRTFVRWSPSIDIAAAMEVASAVIRKGWTFELRWIAVWMARFDSLIGGKCEGYTAQDPATRPAEVICRAALAAVTHNEPERNAETDQDEVESSCPHLHQDFPGTPINKCLDCGALLQDEGASSLQPCPDPRCNDTLGAMPIPQCVTAVAWAEKADSLRQQVSQLERERDELKEQGPIYLELRQQIANEAASRTKAALSAKAGDVAKKIAEYDADDTRTCGNDDCDWYCEHWKADVATIIVDELEKAEL